MATLEIADRLTAMGACQEAVTWVRAYGTDYERAWLECQRADWMLWVAAGVGVELTARTAAWAAYDDAYDAARAAADAAEDAAWDAAEAAAAEGQRRYAAGDARAAAWDAALATMAELVRAKIPWAVVEAAMGEIAAAL